MTATQTESHRFEIHPEGRAPGPSIRGIVESPAGAAEAGEPLPHVVILHGFKGFMHWGFFPELSRRIAASGLVAVRFNMSGSGIGPDFESFSDPDAFAGNTVSRELEDTELVERHVRSGAFPWIDPERAALLGHSMGGAVALLHAARTGTYRSIVTWAAVSTFARFDDETVERWRRDGHLTIPNARTGVDHRLDLGWLEDALDHGAAGHDIRAACASLRTPTLLLHGTEDEAVPLVEGEQLAAALGAAPARGRLVTLDGAGHTFGATHPLTEVGPHLARVIEHSLAELQGQLA